MERMVNRRLMNHLERNEILNHRQYAFRKGKGTNYYLADLDEVITNAAQRGEHCEIVALDISKAYDRVWHRHIMESVIDCDLGTNMNQFINNFLQHRTARLHYLCVVGTYVPHYNNTAGSKSVGSTSPPGTVLSPSIAFDTLIRDDFKKEELYMSTLYW
ncbi:uncharacterized protein LOC134291066 [Aedes albopictus]|uniref:Reverse transcriptase domain-containing protein n=1 Tax=Aedes albopictus TaxID=7160 RepID=A0ABM1ZLL9_AEDAL